MSEREAKAYVQLDGVSIFLILFCISFLVSCGNGQDKKSVSKKGHSSEFLNREEFATQLKSVLKPVDTTGNKKKGHTVSDYVRVAYAQNEFQPFWLNEKGISENAKTLLKEIEDMQWDGIDPERYHLAELKKQAGNIEGKDKGNTAAVVAFDTALTNTYLNASRDLLMGIVPPKIVDSLWFHGNDTIWGAPEMLASELGKNDKYTTLDSFRSKVHSYSLLREELQRFAELMADKELDSLINIIHGLPNAKEADSAAMQVITSVIKTELPWVQTQQNDTLSESQQLLIAYQNYNGMKPSGKADSGTVRQLGMPLTNITAKLKANMERIRWMHRDIGDFYVLVDVPLMELFLRRNDEDAMHMRVVVGRPERQTPSLNATMANVVINPSWGVPPTILKKDVLPGITKNTNYLKKKGLKAYDRKGNVIDATLINSGNYKNYTYKQAPGDGNSLGYVKFNLPNPWDIYLHDTPHREDFPLRYRAKSSGCVRVQRPQEMAIYILSEIEKLHFNQDSLTAMIKTHKTNWKILKNKIPVHIVYLTAYQDTTGNHVRLINDIYKRDARLEAFLR